MADIKFVGTVAIMIACFAVIYPRFMHPLFLRVFGLNDPPKNEKESVQPPNYNNPNHPQQAKKADDIRRHMRAGPHPGMRAAAEMQKQQAQQGSGRGMMGVVLPMYAIGIVLYLVYTLFKVFNKSKGGNDSNTTYKDYRDQRGQYGRRNMRYDRMGFPMDYEGSEDVRGFLNDQQRRHELEELLTKVDDKNVSTEEMRVLQRRLEETEAQMSRILQAMQSVHSNVDRMNIPQEQTEAYDQQEQMDEPEEENLNGDNADDEECMNEDNVDAEHEASVETAASSSPDKEKADHTKEQVECQTPSDNKDEKCEDSKENKADEANNDDWVKNDEEEEAEETMEKAGDDIDVNDSETNVRLRKTRQEIEQ